MSDVEAKLRADLDEWVASTGIIARETSHYFEILSILRSAARLGAEAAYADHAEGPMGGPPFGICYEWKASATLDVLVPYEYAQKLAEERDALRAEVERLRDAALASTSMRSRHDSPSSMRSGPGGDAVDAECERLRKTLLVYGHHRPNCDLRDFFYTAGAPWTPGSCTCGLDAAALGGQP